MVAVSALVAAVPLVLLIFIVNPSRNETQNHVPPKECARPSGNSASRYLGKPPPSIPRHLCLGAAPQTSIALYSAWSVAPFLVTLLSSHCRCCRNLFHTYRRCPGSTWVDHHVPVPDRGDGGRPRCRRDHQYTRPSGQTGRSDRRDRGSRRRSGESCCSSRPGFRPRKTQCTWSH